MRLAYIILAHANPRHLKRMIGALSSSDCSFFVHVDGKSDIGDFEPIEADNIFFSRERLPVYWGEYSIVEATLMLIRQVSARPENYDYYVLLSGSDYPLRSRQYIHAFFERMNGSQFISMVKIPSPGFPLSKINKFSLSSTRPISRFVVRALGRMHLTNRDHRKYLGALQPWAGSQWWALTRDACHYILEFAVKNPSVCEYFRNTFTSDEMFFHTIIGNSSFATRVRKGLMYYDWATANHPGVISSKHLAIFEADEKVVLDDFGPGEVLFARKFSDETLHLIDRLDEIIKGKDWKLDAQGGQARQQPHEQNAHPTLFAIILLILFKSFSRAAASRRFRFRSSSNSCS